MYKKIMIIALVVLGINTAQAQQKFTVEKVITAEGMTKSQIYVKVNEWFATTYNSSNDVIQMNDKEAGIMVGNGSESYFKKGMAYGCYSGRLKYTIKVSAKEGRYKVELTNWMHTIKRGNAPQCELGMLTTAESYATKGMSKKYHNLVWNELKTQATDFSNGMFSSIEKKVSAKDAPANDDW